MDRASILARLALPRSAARSLRFLELARCSRTPSTCQTRSLQTSSKSARKAPDFAFVFDIDGVLLRGIKSLPKAAKTLNLLRRQHIPFVLLTNGGGYHEDRRAEILTEEIGTPIHAGDILQSHTPFQSMNEYKEKCVLVVGGDHDRCKTTARKYGYKKVVTPSDIYATYPDIWPFSRPFASYHKDHAKPLPHKISPESASDSLKIDAIFVYNDPRDWGLDLAIIVDCLLSSQGYLGTLSSHNNDDSLPNRGFQQDGQPPIFFSNPDMWFAATFNLPRLGQGGFRAALDGVWAGITRGPEKGVELYKTVIGKPHRETYEFAERRLDERRRELQVTGGILPPLKDVYMIGDNPESDILGANSYRSALGSRWSSALVRTGVFQGNEPAHKPTVILDNVHEAVQWGIQQSEWEDEVD